MQRELADASHTGGYGHGAGGGPVGAARGVLRESFTLSGKAFEKIETLSEAKQVPLNILVAAAAIAVDASLRQSTATLLIHAVDNRFAEPDLNVATCLVNSIIRSVSLLLPLCRMSYTRWTVTMSEPRGAGGSARNSIAECTWQ
ncbi:peptide synthase [Mycobacteroides abscessus subsp. massiliense]|nr:peptide synthase [Mycobacteroides abscessus subsp. massiliense]